MRIYIAENINSKKVYFNNKKSKPVIEFAESGNTYWEPLYDWLKTFFGEKYKIAANQWMHMAYVKPWEEFEGWLYEYKHGMTRKSLLLDENGIPYNLEYFIVWGRIEIDKKTGETKYASAKKTTYKESFNKTYKDIEKFVKTKEGENPCFVSYNDQYKRKIAAALEAAGYKVCSVDINNVDDFKNTIES